MWWPLARPGPGRLSSSAALLVQTQRQRPEPGQQRPAPYTYWPLPRLPPALPCRSLHLPSTSPPATRFFNSKQVRFFPRAATRNGPSDRSSLSLGTSSRRATQGGRELHETTSSRLTKTRRFREMISRPGAAWFLERSIQHHPSRRPTAPLAPGWRNRPVAVGLARSFSSSPRPLLLPTWSSSPSRASAADDET